MRGVTAAPRTALVTGASGSIGGASVRALLAEGLFVVGIDRAPSTIEAERYRHLVQELMVDDASTEQLEVTLADMPPLAHVVGVAGGALPEEPTSLEQPEAIGVELFRASIDANLVTQFMIVAFGLERFKSDEVRGEDRSITLISSFNALSAQGMPAYSAAKAGLIGLMYGLVEPAGRWGVRVNVVAPGTIRTPRTERIWANDAGHFDRLAAGTALGRLGSPEDVGDAVVALTLRLRHVTGHTLVVDGGQTAIHR